MKWFYNMKIASKLILGFILVAAIACAIGGIGWSQIKVIDASDTILYEKNAKPLGEIGLISTDFQRIRVNLRDIIMDEGTPQRQKYVDTVKLLDSDIDKNMSSFEAGIASEEVRQKFNTLKADIAEWKPVQDRIIALGVANQDDQALALLRGDGKKIADNVMANIDWMVDKKTIQAKERSEENTATANKAINMMIAFIIGGILLALALGLFISRVISNPIKNLADIAEKLAVGDVDVKVEATTKDEVGDLMGAFGEMIAGIKAKAEAAQRIAKGDVNFEVNAMSEKDVLAISMKQVVEALRGLIAESDMLTKAAVAGKLDTRGSADKFAGGYKDIVEGVNSTLDSVIGPLNVAAEYVDRISKGDIPPKITDTYNGDFNEIKNNLNQCIDAINLLVADANVLSVAAVQGKLDTRAEANKHHGDFRRIVQGVNDTLDAIIGPLNVAAEYVERIAKGDIPPEITDTYNGDFNEIKNNLNTCIGAIGTLVEEMGNIIDASKEGRLDARADDNKANGVYRKLLRGINETVDAFVGPINVTAEYVDRISKGQIPPKITDDYNGDFNEIKNNLNNCIDVMNGLLQETDLLIKATQEGRLDTRGKADKFAGGWGQLVGGVNNLIDAFVGPINVTAEYVDRISKGDIPPKITDEYYGDFNEIKNNLNSCIEVMSGLLQETDLLIKATQEGRLDTRGKADIYAGGWGELVGGVNNLIDAFVGPINVTAEYVDRISKGDIPPKITDTYYGDFNEIKNNLNNCIDVMSGLLQETDLLIKATKEGRLDTRGKADKFAGGWGELVSGVNDLINAFVGPINVTAEYVDRISKGDIPPKITDTYYGDFNEIKNNLNNCIDVMRGLLDETGTLIKATQDGKLDTRGKADKFAGGWGELVSGVNDLIDAFVAPINVTAEYVDRISKGEIPQKITDIYKGDFNEIKNNLNNCIDGLGGLVECNHILHRMSMNDHTTGVEGQYQGLYGEMAHATNEIRDRLVGVTRQINEIAVGDTTELEALKKVGKRCEEDKLLPAVIECMDVIELLIKDTMALAAASVDGKLSTRADVSKHHGEYRKIVQGINDTLDAVIDPVQEAAAVMNEMAKGNLQIRVTGNYKGDHAQIKDALNDTIDSVKGYINEVSNVLNEMANGNLDVSIQSEFRGDFIAMKDSINMIINAFNEVMEEINTAANQVASGSNQVSDSSQSLSQASTEQAASIEEITASITEVAAQTKQNAVNANQANELALSAKENAVQGDEEMQEMLKAMSEINESSANISKIIKVIDEIAFQTNILALNAAVEAARAGQHGKGFAVVAEEVRNLAARSANAAKETTVMIEGSIQKVEQGTKIANGTAEALNKIVGGVAKAADLVGNIAIASNEQATAIAQIDQGLAQVSDVTQMNTATAEQSASASQQLASQAELLKERVARFKLRKHGAAIGGMAGVSPEILKAIRDAVARNNGPAGHHEEAKAEAAAASAAPSNGAAPKIKISLDDMEFGKY